MRKYFVSYVLTDMNSGNHHFSNIQLESDKLDINKFEKDIRRIHNYEWTYVIVVLNFIKLEV